MVAGFQVRCDDELELERSVRDLVAGSVDVISHIRCLTSIILPMSR